MSPTTSKVKIIFDLLTKLSSEKRPNVILVLENDMIFSYKDRLTWRQWASGWDFMNNYVNTAKPKRGDVLDFFAQLELIVNQIFVVNLVEKNDVVKKFEQILDTIDFFSKIRLLNQWSLIDNTLNGKLTSLRKVRNGFAHVWNIEEVKYKNKPILENISKFKEDAREVFVSLVKIYNRGEINLDVLIEKLKLKN